MGRLGADIPVGSQSQGVGTRIPARFSGFQKDQETRLFEPHITQPVMRGLAQPNFVLKSKTVPSVRCRDAKRMLFFLSPWMRLIVNLGQVLEVQVGVDLGG
jgi:hypothetical protein